MVKWNNWEIKKLDEIVFYQEGPGVRNHQYTEKGVKLLNVANLSEGKLDLKKSDRFISEEEAYGRYKHFLVDEGDLIIACSGIKIDYFHKKIAYVKKEHLPLCMNTSTMRFKVLDEKILKIDYLSYFFKTIFFKEQIRKLITGSAQLNFGPSHIKKIKIPVPDLETQKKIVEILDKAQSFIDKRKEQIKLFDDLIQSIFYDMFGDPVRNEKNWEIKTIEELVKKEKYSIKRGPFGGTLKKEIFVKEGYLVYEQYHALNNDFSFERYFINEEKFNELKAFEVKSNDIIISCSGVYLGKLAIIPNNSKKGIINQALLKISLDELKIRNIFFVLHFTQNNFKNTFFYSNRGAGIPNFPSMVEFKKFPFICPPIELQNEFTKKVEAIEKEKNLLENSLKELEKNYNALVQKAFKGKLF